MGDMTTRLLTLCNSYVPAELREICLMCVKEMLMLWPTDMLGLLVPLLHRSHNSASESTENMTLGPYFPRLVFIINTIKCNDRLIHVMAIYFLSGAIYNLWLI